MKREQFLNNIWKRYPAMPPRPVAWGRLLEVIDDQLVLESGLKMNMSQDLVGVLRTGDVIAVTEASPGQQEIHLLAPQIEPVSHISSSPEIQIRFSDYLEGIRKYFKSQDFIESFTPTLVECPGTEPFLDYFSTEFTVGKFHKKMYLPTSPELHLKKLLASGYSRIFEIKNCFRNGEAGTHHEPEFMMLEWYRSYSTLEQIQFDLQSLISALSGRSVQFHVTTMADQFREKLGFNLTPETTQKEFYTLLRSKGQIVSEDESLDDLFARLVVDYIEPGLDQNIPTIITHYPPFQAAYARLTVDGWADRFELFWRGLEIANAFHEVNDPELQLQRMNQDLNKKKTIGKEIPSLDMEFIQSLRSGVPPAGGIALGVERLFMALNHIEDIRDIKVFPMRRFL